MDKHICTLPKQQTCIDVPPTASWLRRQLCLIRRAMLPCEWHHGTTAYLRSRNNLMIEKDRQLASGHWLMWHPYSPMKIYWDSFYLILNIAVFVYMPFQVFFICPNPYDLFILFCDFMALVDICTKFLTGYNEEGNKHIVLKPKDIAKKYIKGTFVFDLIGALPLQLYQPHEKCEFPTHTVMFVFKLTRLVSLKDNWVNVYQQLQLSYVAAVAIGVLVKAILFFHWMTYLHYQVPAFFSHYYAHNVVWGKRFQVINEESLAIFQRYTTNLYWVCALCVGAGYYNQSVDNYIIPDLLLTSFIGITGLLFIVYSFTTVLRLFMYGQHDKYLYNGRLKDLEEYMEMKRLPNLLKKKIFLFLEYKYHGSFFNEHAIQSTINEQVKQDINMHFCKQLVTSVPIFQDMPVAFINSIIFSLTSVLFMPGETVATCGEPMDCLYMISSGTVAVMNSVGKEITHLRDGAYAGEDALSGVSRLWTTTIIALEITQMYKCVFLFRLDPFGCRAFDGRARTSNLSNLQTHFRSIPRGHSSIPAARPTFAHFFTQFRYE